MPRGLAAVFEIDFDMGRFTYIIGKKLRDAMDAVEL